MKFDKLKTYHYEDYMYKMNAPKTVVNDCHKLGYFCKMTKRGGCNMVDDCPT